MTPLRPDTPALADARLRPMAPRPRLDVRTIAALAARLRGPGGFYNAGNLLGLTVGIGLQLALAAEGADAGDTLLAYLAGNASAFATTCATVIFLIAGEFYHRVWPAGGAPDERLNRIADLLSGVGAIALGCALWLLGQPVLAATSGALHAFGKLASAAWPDGQAHVPFWPRAWADPFRIIVVASRAPGLLAAGADLAISAAALAAGGPLSPLVLPATLLACYLLWTRADLLLFAGGKRGPRSRRGDRRGGERRAPARAV